ncbi:MAG: RnfABCDGE type electron transport complex subunit D [Acholeplasmataceae bacterium]|nr:RnfABCDGE type electron transport complex subunit D [Acholeplasmataceae bacterium]
MQAFVKETSPYIRKDTSVKRMMFDVLIALIPLVIFAIYKFKIDAVLRIVLAVAAMILTECIVVMVRHRPHPRVKGFKNRFLERFSKISLLNVITPSISAIIFVLMVPSKLPLYVVFVSAALGILVAKMLFGGLGSNIFNPAAVAFIIALISFASSFSYVGIDAVAGATPLGAVGSSLNNIPNLLKSYSLTDLLLGNIPGGMGEISALLILVGGAYLFIRKSADFRITLSMLLAFSLLMVVAALAVKGDVVNILLYQLLTGGLLYGAIFMATDPVTAPITKPGRWIYGLLLGALVVVIRLFGSHVEGVAFAILISNMFVPLIDYYKWSNPKYTWKMWLGYGVMLLVLCLIVFIGLGGL